MSLTRIWLVLKILIKFQVINLENMVLGSQSIPQIFYILFVLIFNFMIIPDFTYLISSFLFFLFLIQIDLLKNRDFMIVMKSPTHVETILGLARVYHSFCGMISGRNIPIGRSRSAICFQC